MTDLGRRWHQCSQLECCEKYPSPSARGLGLEGHPSATSTLGTVVDFCAKVIRPVGYSRPSSHNLCV